MCIRDRAIGVLLTHFLISGMAWFFVFSLGVNLLSIFFLLIKKGQKETNKYGQMPVYQNKQSHLLFCLLAVFLPVFVGFIYHTAEDTTQDREEQKIELYTPDPLNGVLMNGQDESGSTSETLKIVFPNVELGGGCYRSSGLQFNTEKTDSAPKHTPVSYTHLRAHRPY